MNEALIIWFLFIIVPQLGIAAGILCFVSAIITAITTATIVLDTNLDEDGKAKGSIILKIAVPILLITSLLSVLLPDREDIKFIAGGYAVVKSAQYIADSDEAKKLPDNILKLANKFLEDVTGEGND